MSYAEQSMAAAAARRLALETSGKSQAAVSPGGVVASTSVDPLQAQASSQLTSHGEQLRHYSGRVYSNLRAIAHRAAAQPIVVAKLHAQGSSKRAKFWTQQRPGSHCQRRIDALPAHLKNVADQLEPLPNHELTDILNDPNGLMVGWTLKAVTQIHLGLTGKAYWWLVPPGKAPAKRKPAAKEKDYAASWQIWPMPPNWVEPKHKGDRAFDHYTVRAPNSSKGVDVPAENMLYFYYPNPADPFGATGPLQAQGRQVASHEAMSEAQRRSFHRPLPGLMFTIGRHPDAKEIGADPGQRPALSPAQRAQITTWVESMYRGFSQYDKPLIIDAIIEKVEKLTQSNREMDYLNSTKIVMQQIDEGFGTNPIVLGRIEGANRASAAAAEDNFCRNTVNPTLMMMSEVLTAWLGPLFSSPTETLVVYVEPATVTDPDFELKRAATALQGACSDLNEFRGMIGLPPRDGGERYLVTPQGLLEAFNDKGEIELPEPIPIAEPDPNAPPAAEDDEEDDAKPPKKPADETDDEEKDAKK